MKSEQQQLIKRKFLHAFLSVITFLAKENRSCLTLAKKHDFLEALLLQY
jgi:hypothetical protein